MSTEIKGAETSPKGRRLALVIGVNQTSEPYPPPLKYAINDAEEIARVLQEKCNFEIVDPELRGDKATSGEVKLAIGRLALQAKPDDLLLFYFSGHGYPLETALELTGTVTHLGTSDFSADIAEALGDAVALPMRWLHDVLFEKSPATQIIIILDCCYAEDVRTPKNYTLETLRQRINAYFQVPGAESGQRQGVLRVVLAASRYDEVAREQDGHGNMTNLLLKTLNGEVDEVLGDKGQIKISRLIDYIKEEMQKSGNQTPAVTLVDAQSRDCILASYPERAEELRRRGWHAPVNLIPHSYIAKRPRGNYQATSGAFEYIDKLLFEADADGVADSPRIVGLIGMGGLGKTRLALELAYRYEKELRFPGGVFWLPAAGTDRVESQRRLAELASQTEYLPEGDDVANPENESRRARHMARYLASHADAFCVLDNVDDLDFVLDSLTELAGQSLACHFLYTSRNQIIAPGVKPYRLTKLDEEGALGLLLWRRSDSIEILPESETRAAREICRHVDYLPLPLTWLGDLLQDQQLSVRHLLEVLIKRGALGIAYSSDPTKKTLFETFQLSWEKLRNLPNAQRLFKLIAFFPEAAPIPLWLPGIASGLGEDGKTRLEPLGSARFELESLSLIEPVSDAEIRLHPLLREFGQYLVKDSPVEEQPLSRADEKLLKEFTNINLLKQRIQREGFWTCLSRVQEVATYTRLLVLPHVNIFEGIERWLIRDSSLLANPQLEPEAFGRLLWQQLSNRALEEGLSLSGVEPAGRWLKQLKSVGAENRALLHELKHPDVVTCLVYAPDGRRLVTGDEAGVVRIWDVVSGELLRELPIHESEIRAIVFNPTGAQLATCAFDQTVQLLQASTGKIIRGFKGLSEAAVGVVFSPDGQELAAFTENGNVQIWNIITGERMADFFNKLENGEHLSAASYLQDGKTLVLYGSFKTLFFLDLGTMNTRMMGLEGGGKFLSDFAVFSSDRLLLLDEIVKRDQSQFQFEIWNLKRGQLEDEFTAIIQNEGRELTGGAFSVDGHYVISSFNNGQLLIWDRERRELKANLSCGYDLTQIIWSPDGRFLAGLSQDTFARIWKIDALASFDNSTRLYTLDGLTLSTDGSVLAVWDGYDVAIWDTASNLAKSGMSLAHAMKTILNTCFSVDGKQLFVAERDLFPSEGSLGQSIQTWNINSIPPEAVMSVDFSKSITCLTCFPGGPLMALGMGDESIQIWDAEQKKVLKTLRGHQGTIERLAVSSNGAWLISGCTDGTARVWETGGYTLRRVLKGQVGPVTALCIAPDSSFVIIGDFGGNILIWNLSASSVHPVSFVLSLKQPTGQPLTCLNISPDGRYIVAADRTGQVVFWRREAGELRMMGSYSTVYPVEAIHWQGDRQVLLIDQGGTTGRPYFYRLELRGDGW